MGKEMRSQITKSTMFPGSKKTGIMSIF